jgi:hypothetical protein
MRQPKLLSPPLTVVVALSFVAAVLGAAATARAAGKDPSVGAPPAVPDVPESNVAEPSTQAPASAPAGSEANFPTGLVERLPSSAYPEPVIRGLYGSSLWLDMQGLQWPYYPRIGVGISGYGWVDTAFKRTRIGDPTQSDHTTNLFMQGRYDLRVTPTYSNGTWFVQLQAEIIANLNQLDPQPLVADTDDLWVRTGVWKSWDVTVGRFEAFPVYHLGMGLDLNTDERIGAYDAVNGIGQVPQAYLASYLYYRPQGPANIALHLYPAVLPGLRIELLAQWGNDNLPNLLLNTLGARPAAIYDLGWLKFRLAAEYQWRFPPDPAPSLHNEYRNRGIAGSVQFVLAPWLEFGPNFGRAITDVWTPSSTDPDKGASGDIVSYGGFVNACLLPDMLIGAGYNYVSFTNLHTNSTTGENDKSTNTQYFVALQYLVHHQLFVKVVGGYAKTHFDFRVNQMVPYDDDMFSVRVRLMYLY